MKYQEVYSHIIGKPGTYEIRTEQGRELKRLFVSQNNTVCEFAYRSRKHGYPININTIAEWIDIQPYKPHEENIVAKFKRYASRASFHSAFIRKCLDADESKDCYENRLTTGTRIDGEIISLKAIERFAPWEVVRFRKALQERRNYTSGRFNFRGYDGTLWVEIVECDGSYYRKGDIKAGFDKEYRDCGNGYYYSLIDDEHFIGTDID